MRDSDDSHVVSELVPQRLLDDSIRLVVCVAPIMLCTQHSWRSRVRTDSRGRFVEYEQLALAHDRPRKRNNRALSYREIIPATSNLCVQRYPVLLREALEREQSSGLQGVVQSSIVEFFEHVEVLTQGSSKQLGLRICDRISLSRLKRDLGSELTT